MTTYPIGYGTETVSLDELRRRHSPGMHPAFDRRLFAWIESRGGAVGIGSGHRPTPDPVSPASQAGHSFHQDQRYASGVVAFSAVDLVVKSPGNVHRAPTWSEVPKQDSGHADIGRFGVHCNVSDEPWHMQCIEQDGWQTWVDRGRPDPDVDYPIDGDAPEPIPPAAGRPDIENGEYGLYPLDPNKPTVARDANPTCEHVGYVQAVLRNECGLTLDVDDRFGPDTDAAVRTMQGWNDDLAVDGRVGPATWRAVDVYSAG